MKQLALLFLSLMVCLSAEAQKGKTSRNNHPRQQVVQKANSRTQTKTKKKAKANAKPQTKTSKQQDKPSASIAGLTAEKKKVQKQREASLRKQEELKRSVKRGMENLMVIDTEIARQRSIVDTIRHDITTLDGHISLLDSQLVVLEDELEDRRHRYMKSMRYMHRNRSVQSQMAFVLSADNFNQMYRRLRFNREYAAYQKAQGEAIVSKQQQITQKRKELNTTKLQKDTLLVKGRQAQQRLEGKQSEQKAQVQRLKREQRTVEALIEQQRQQEAELNARIDKLIAEEIAREKARQEAEARRRAEEEAAREKKRQQEAEAAWAENERRLSEAKAKEEQARKEAQAAADKDAQERERVKRNLELAEREVEVAEQRAKEAKEAKEISKPAVEREEHDNFRMPSADTKLSGSFEANRGRLPLPISGAYKLVRGFGPYSPEGLGKVRLQSNGWHLKGVSGARAQCIFDGIVSGIYYQGNQYIVTVRHGKYISVYINLASVSVRNGQKVSTRQQLGKLGSDNTMQFQLRNWNNLLNPAKWIRR